MAKLRELLGTDYKDGMTVEEAEKILSSKNIVDLSTGEYVSKAKWYDDTKQLETYKKQVESKQSEIEAAVNAAVEKAKAEAQSEYEKQLNIERTKDKRSRAKQNHYKDLNDEQKSIYDAFLKEEDLKLSEEKDEFTNFEELTKPIKEKFKTMFPVDNGSHGAAGLPPKSENKGTGSGATNIFDFGFSNAPKK